MLGTDERPTFVLPRETAGIVCLVMTRTSRMLHTNNVTSSRCKAMLRRRPSLAGPIERVNRETTVRESEESRLSNATAGKRTF